MNSFSFGEWRFTISTDFVHQGMPVGRLDRQLPDGKWQIMGPNGIGKVQDTPLITDEDIWTFQQEHLQAILDGLWKYGLRPNDKRYEEEAKLRDSHLQDMRRIAFKDFPA